jgi:Sporulation and spore germination
VAVEVPLERRQAALQGSIEALLSMTETYDTRSGLYNALHASRLKIDRIERSGAEAKVYLKGYLEIGGECDSPRVLAQLTETALQFPDVQRASFYLEGKPLAGLLSGRGQ